MKQPETLTQLLAERKEENGMYIKTQSKQLPVSTSPQKPQLSQQRQWLLQRFPTVEYFFSIFSPQRQLLICQDPIYCFFGPSPTLTEVDIMYGSFTSAKWLIPLIADASLSCGLKEDVTKDAGFYERFYSYFDTQTIIRSVKTFIEERTLAIAAHERNT